MRLVWGVKEVMMGDNVRGGWGVREVKGLKEV